MSDMGYVILAYALTWSALAVFAGYLVRRRQRALRRLQETEPLMGGHR